MATITRPRRRKSPEPCGRRSPAAGPRSIAERLRRLDWQAIAHSLDKLGYARSGPVLTAAECRSLIELYPNDRHFRSRIAMERYRFGIGSYAYFGEPLPALVRSLRTHAYRYLAPIANGWARALGDEALFPASLQSFRARCRAAGQTRPTPLVLRYTAGGYNRLHQDLYGGIVFPLQIAIVLERPGLDYEGGELLLVEQLPRTQSRGLAIAPARGELVIFPSSERPVPGRRGPLRARVRHGASLLHAGTRHVLGIIFHDAR